MSKLFAVYKGEELLTMGTAKKCAEDLNVKVDTVYYYKSKTYQNRGSGNNRRITIDLGNDLEDM